MLPLSAMFGIIRGRGTWVGWMTVTGGRRLRSYGSHGSDEGTPSSGTGVLFVETGGTLLSFHRLDDARQTWSKS